MSTVGKKKYDLVHGHYMDPKPKKGFKWIKLKVGKRYVFTSLGTNGKPLKVREADGSYTTRWFSGRVVREYPSWYLVQCRDYMTGVHKRSLGVDVGVDV